MIDYKSVWGFFDIPIGCRENLFWSWRIEYLPIVVTWERVKEEVFGKSEKPHTLLRIDNQGTFWPNFARQGRPTWPCVCPYGGSMFAMRKKVWGFFDFPNTSSFTRSHVTNTRGRISANIQFTNFKIDFLGNQSEYWKSLTHFCSLSPTDWHCAVCLVVRASRKAGNSV